MSFLTLDLPHSRMSMTFRLNKDADRLLSSQWGRSISAAEIGLTETSVLLQVLTHDASTRLSARNHFHIEQVAPPPSQTAAYKIMQLQSREHFQRFSRHRTARTRRQLTPSHHVCLPLDWREHLPQRFNVLDRTPFGRTKIHDEHVVLLMIDHLG